MRVNKGTTGISPSGPGIKHLILLNIFAPVFYLIIIRLLYPEGNVSGNLFSTSDSMEYNGYMEWLEGSTDYYNSLRTYFYPLLLLIVKSLFGMKAIWPFQAVLWLISCNLTWLSVWKITRNRWFAYLAFLLIVTNISYIEMTTEALTEATVTFLLSVLAYVAASHYKQLFALRSWLAILFILAILTATKPVFQPLTYLVFIFFILHTIVRKASLINILAGITVLTPMFIQAYISIKNGKSGVKIELADSNLKKYLYRKTAYLADQGSLEGFDKQAPEAESKKIEQSLAKPKSEVIRYLATHPVETVTVLHSNISENLGSGNSYIKNRTLALLYHASLQVIYLVHMLVPIVLLIVGFRYRKQMDERFGFILAMEFIFLYVVITTSIVFWAGDRMTMPAISVWIPGYVVLLEWMFRNFKTFRQGQNR